MEGLADGKRKNIRILAAFESAGSIRLCGCRRRKCHTAAQEAEAASVSADEASSRRGRVGKISESCQRAMLMGGTGVRPNENVDSSQYYYEQAKKDIPGLEGALLPMGTIAFAQLPVVTRQAGYMYNIMDDFTTDNTFKEGAGYTYPAGTNVYYTADGIGIVCQEH